MVYRRTVGGSGIADFVAQRGGRVLDDYDGFDVLLARTAEGVDPEYPEQSDRAEELDGRSVADLIDELDPVPEARFLIEADTRSYDNAEPADISLLFLGPAVEHRGRRPLPRRGDHAGGRRQQPAAGGDGGGARGEAPA